MTVQSWMESSGRREGGDNYQFGDVTRSILNKFKKTKIKKEIKKIYGWRPDIPDYRDLKAELSHLFNELPSNVDLRKNCPDVYNQGTLGSCTANAIAGAFEYDQMKEKNNGQSIEVFHPSRLFIYYCEREMENSVSYDSGAMIRDGIKVINKLGCCDEKYWPYDISQFTVKPDDNAYEQASKHKSIKYFRLHQYEKSLKACLTAGFPFVFGFTVFSSFETEEVAKTGIMTMPKENEKQLGGHAVCCVGYDDEQRCFIVRNSWGEEWGDNGYFYMPYEYMTNAGLASDFWTIRWVV